MFFSKRFLQVLVLAIAVSLAGAAWAQSDPIALEVRYQNGVKYFNRGLYDRAAAEFERVLEMDPDYEDAKVYLEKIRQRAEEKAVPVPEGEKAEADGIRELTAEAKKLYAQRDFEAALEVFNKILEKRPIDDYASYYKERCEIFISKKLTRERKAQDKARQLEKAEEQKRAREDAKARKAQEREEMLRRREEIDQERREARQAKAPEKAVVPAPEEAPEVVVAAEEKAPEPPAEILPEGPLSEPVLEPEVEKPDQLAVDETAPAAGKDDRKAAAERKRFLKEEEKQQRLQEKEAARQEKLRLAEERRQEKQALKEEKAAARQQQRDEKQADARWNAIDSTVKKQEKKQAKSKATKEKEEQAIVHASVRDLYLTGVEQYARRDYPEAILSFEAVIEAERQGRAVYSGAAGRMIEKTKKRQENAQEKTKN